MRLGIALSAILATVPISASALPISVDANGDPNEIYHFRDIRGPNSVGFAVRDSLAIGALNVLPSGKDGTTATATQNGATITLQDFSSTVHPNQMVLGIPYDANLTGSWDVTFVNGADMLTVSTPAPGAIANAGFATDLTQSGGGTTPTFSWVNPNGPERVSLSIFDLERRQASNGFADRIFVTGVSGTSFTIPDGVLEADHLYAVGIEADLLYQGGTNPSGASRAGAIRSRSRTFFDFSTGTLPDIGDIFLPMVDTSGGTPVFHFDNAVIAGQVEYYDPIVAVGYDYAIGAGDPLFASVILPDIGDGLFDLALRDTQGGFVSVATLAAGSEYSFANGVAEFRITGIEIDAGLDPSDATAFVTGLSFTETGRFTGKMTPIVVDTTPVPLPFTAPLLLFGLLMLGHSRRP